MVVFMHRLRHSRRSVSQCQGFMTGGCCSHRHGERRYTAVWESRFGTEDLKFCCRMEGFRINCLWRIPSTPTQSLSTSSSMQSGPTSTSPR